MKFALVNGEKKEATQGQYGICQCCGSEVVAKCGTKRIWHWAHKIDAQCSYSKKEPKTLWHQEWQNRFPEAWQEERMTDLQSGESHIADIKAPQIYPFEMFIEFQHSSIDDNERIVREQFYRFMVWVVDCTVNNRKSNYKKIFNVHKLINDSRLLDKIEGCSRISGKNNVVKCDSPELHIPAEWLNCKVPVFFDAGTLDLERRPEKHIPVLIGFVKTGKGESYIIKVSKNDFVCNCGRGTFFKWLWTQLE